MAKTLQPWSGLPHIQCGFCLLEKVGHDAQQQIHDHEREYHREQAFAALMQAPATEEPAPSADEAPLAQETHDAADEDVSPGGDSLPQGIADRVGGVGDDRPDPVAGEKVARERPTRRRRRSTIDR